MDLDLPEIEDMPTSKAQILANGKISVKQKTTKELQEDYLKSVAGLCIYFASIGFSSVPKIDNIIVSGYTQRINKATGNIQDDYVVSVAFDTMRFSQLNIEQIDPVETIGYFNGKLDLTKTMALKTITPYTFDEILNA